MDIAFCGGVVLFYQTLKQMSENDFKGLDEVEQYRRSKDAQEIADLWVAEEKLSQFSGPAHMKVQYNCLCSPYYGLGDVLNLVYKSENNAAIEESVAMGPADDILNAGDDHFVSTLKAALVSHKRFELFTRGRRFDPAFFRYQKLGLAEDDLS